VYLLVADKYNGPVPCLLRVVSQPVMSSSIEGAGPRSASLPARRRTETVPSDDRHVRPLVGEHTDLGAPPDFGYNISFSFPDSTGFSGKNSSH
jgi:hypothetical protein